MLENGLKEKRIQNGNYERRSTVNREQRRKEQKKQKWKNIPPTMGAIATKQEPDFSGVPLATMCQSIQMLINSLYERGYPIYDFDNKNKSVRQIQIIQGKVFFLAAEEVGQ